MQADSSLAGYSDDQLQGGQKTFLTLLVVLSVLESLFLAYVAYLLGTGQFDFDRHLLAVVPIAVLMLAALPVAVNLGRYRAELARRSESGS